MSDGYKEYRIHGHDGRPKVPEIDWNKYLSSYSGVLIFIGLIFFVMFGFTLGFMLYRYYTYPVADNGTTLTTTRAISSGAITSSGEITSGNIGVQAMYALLVAMNSTIPQYTITTGEVTLSPYGNATITETSINSTSLIFYGAAVGSTATGGFQTTSKTPGVGFVINSVPRDSNTNVTVSYVILKPR